MGKANFFILFSVIFLTYNPALEGYWIPPEKENIIILQAVNENVESRLEYISKRKEEIRLELEKLKKEEEQLIDDIKKEGSLMSVRKKRELEHRSRELEEKIKRFIEELEKLNQEEQGLLGIQKPM
ncbi:MAG: hypothetical protein AABY78_07975 [Nitrospirota bacterium]